MRFFIAAWLVFLLKTRDICCFSQDELNGESDGDDESGEGLVQLYIDYWQASLQQEHVTHQLSGLRENMEHIYKQLVKANTSTVAMAMIDEMRAYNEESESGINREKRSITRHSYTRWPKGVVPYDPSRVDYGKQNEIRRAQLDIERFTCIRFLPWRYRNGSTPNEILELGHSTYLKYVSGGGCWSLVGKSGNGGQDISCCGGSTCVHENGHALGLFHEQATPDPERKWMISINWNNIKTNKWSQYRANPITQANPMVGYDLSTYMHYSKFGFSNGNGKTYNTLFPEMERMIKSGQFYLMKEVSVAHGCEDHCPQSRITCHNDGYLTKVDGVCKCMCVPGLDPDTGCTTIIRSTTSNQGFPTGKYALPQPRSGQCFPNSRTGTVVHFTEGPNSVSSMFDINANVSGTRVELHFCVTTNIRANTVKWPAGNYCIYRKGGQCPENFENGAIQYDDIRTGNSRNGEIPDGVFGRNTKFEYCCRSNGFSKEQIYLPNRDPFVLIRHKNDDCQEISGMHYYEQEYSIVNSEGENIAGIVGDYVNGYYGFPLDRTRNINGATFKTRFCYYKPAMIDCGDIIDLSINSPSVTFSPPSDPELDCTWLIKAPENENIILSFDNFNVDPVDHGGDCHDQLEIRYLRPGQKGFVFTGSALDRTFQSINNTILLRFITCGSSVSTFTATAKLSLKENLCYNSNDRGVSYVGNVSFTRFFEACVPWVKALECNYHPFGHTNREFPYFEESNTLLKDNYCRNPDSNTGIMPWCYTDSETCERNYCDVCQLGTVYDIHDDCANIAQIGMCDQLKSVCAKTCGYSTPDPPGKASDIFCPQPPNVSDGSIIENGNQESYSPGDKVTYKCNQSPVTRTRLCLTSGEWSQMGFVCELCRNGWLYEDTSDTCYSLFDGEVTLNRARDNCIDLGGYLVEPSTEIVNEFIRSMISNNVWLPLEYNQAWLWIRDGRELDWSNWESRPVDLNMKQCAIITPDGSWRNTRCSYTYPYVCAVPKETPSFQCNDFESGCQDIFNSDPLVCQTHPIYVHRFCPFTCGFCDPYSTSHCPVAMAPANGYTDTPLMFVPRGTVVTYNCNDGYSPAAGDSIRGCLANGQLSGIELVCKENCPANWAYMESNRHCYGLIGETVDYETASQKCKMMGGYLAMPKTAEEVDAIVEASASLRTGEFVWVGISDRVVEDLYLWDDGRIVTFDIYFRDWWKNEDCGRMTINGDWKNEFSYCTEEHEFVCQVPLSVTTGGCDVEDPTENALLVSQAGSVLLGNIVEYECKPNYIVGQGNEERICLINGNLSGETLICILPCPLGWIFYEYKCFYFVNEAMNFEMAVSTCDAFNSLIAMPKTWPLTTEIRRIRDSINRNQLMFIGLNYIVDSGFSIWADGTKAHSSDFRWHRDPSDSETCVIMSSRGYWYASHCTRSYRFMCESSYYDLIAAIQPCNVEPPGLNVVLQSSEETVDFNEVVTYSCNGGFVKSRGDTERQCLVNGILGGETLQCMPGCPDRWTFYEHKCFLFKNEEKNYDQAKDTCNNLNSTLAMPKTLELNEEIVRIRDLTNPAYWILFGLTLNDDDATFSWDDGTISSWSNWRFIYGSSWNSYRCVIYKTGSKWYRDRCSNNRRFICEASYYDLMPSCDVNPPINGVSNALNGKVNVGGVVAYQCNDGFKQKSGDTVRTCLDNTELNGELLVCETFCTLESSPINGRASTNMSYVFVGEEVGYVCNEGYRISSGETERTCLITGNLSGTLLVCEEVECELGPPPANGQINSNVTSVVIGTVVTFTCNEGFVVADGNTARTCRSDGQLDGLPLICELPCPGNWVFSGLSNNCYGLLLNVLSDYTNSVDFCQRLGSLLATPKTENENRRIWEMITGEVVSTSEISFPLDPPVWIGLKKVNNQYIWSDGDILVSGDWENWLNTSIDTQTYGCTSMAPQSGKWVIENCNSIRRTVCQIPIQNASSECEVDQPANGRAETNSSSVPLGTTVTYTCDDGFVPLHRSSRTCQINGQLSGEPIVCIRPCPGGWTLSPNGQYCYRLSNETQNYATASSKCAELSGTLATPKSVEQNIAIAALVDSDYAWIGLDAIENGVTFVWADGQQLGSWNNWNNGEPELGDELCVLFASTKWRGKRCSFRRKFVCQIENSIIVSYCSLDNIPENGNYNVNVSTIAVGSTVTYSCNAGYESTTSIIEQTCLFNGRLSGPEPAPCVKSCPNGWKVSQQGHFCYKFYSELINYNAAVAVCEGVSGALAEPRTSIDNDILDGIRADDRASWIGLNDILEEGSFVWGNNDTLVSTGWDNWAQGQPNRGGVGRREDCVVMEGGLWYDYRCTVRKATLCQVSSDLVREECVVGLADTVSIASSTNITNRNSTNYVSLGISVTFACIEGYESVSGSTERTCSINGEMTGEPLSCVKQCPGSWTASSDKLLCYKYNPNKMTYDDAYLQCGEKGASLSMPRNAGENSLVRSLFRDSASYIWIGLTRIGETQDFIWNDNETLIWENWIADLPSTDISKSCVKMKKKNTRWFDTTCSAKLSFVCQIPANETQSECDVSGVNNGSVSTSDSKVPLGTVLNYTCDEDFVVMSGSGQRTCQVNGQMSGRPLECGQPCPEGHIAYTNARFAFCYKFEQQNGLNISIPMDQEPREEFFEKLKLLIHKMSNNPDSTQP